MKRLIDFEFITYGGCKFYIIRFLRKFISSILLFALILQSCVVYHSTPIALEDAYNKGMVKLVAADGSKLKYDNLIQKEGVIYGATGYSKDTTNFWREYIRDEEGKKVPYYTTVHSEIRSAHLKNKFVTTTLHILPPLAAGIGILFIVLLASGMGSFSY